MPAIQEKAGNQPGDRHLLFILDVCKTKPGEKSRIGNQNVTTRPGATAALPVHMVEYTIAPKVWDQ